MDKRWFMDTYLNNIVNPIIFDIGANDGKDSDDWKILIPDSQLYCFEPDYSVYRKLDERMSRWITQENNTVHLFNYAISDSNAHVPFYSSYPTDQSGSLLKPKKHLDYYPQISFKDQYWVDTITLNKFVERHDIKHIDLIWMDVQGAELKVFKGASEALKKVDYIYTEFSNMEMYDGAPSLDNILDMLPDWKLEKIIWQWEADGSALLVNKGENK